MKVFKCTNCGKAILAFDENIGMEVTCPYCQASLPVPQENDSDCIQVFTEGAPDCGLAMTLQELEAALTQGTANGDDLVYYEGSWKPINQVFQIPESHQEAPEERPPSQLPTVLSQLSPLDGYQKLPFFGKAKPVKQRKPAVSSKARRILTAAAALAVFLIAAESLTRVINFALERYSSITIYNGWVQPINVQTPEGRIVLQPTATYSFSHLLTGLLPFGKKITYSLQQNADGQWQQETIRIRPNEAFLLNPASSSSGIATFRPALLAEAKLPENDLKRLASEISAGQAPTAAAPLFSYAAKQFKDVYAGTSSEHIFYSSKYDFHNIPTGLSKNSEKPGDDALLLCLSSSQCLPFQDGEIEFKSNGDLSKLTFDLPLGSMLINGQSVEISSARFTIFTNENNLLCIAIQAGSKGKLSGQNASVLLDYSAHRNMAGEWLLNAAYK